MNREQSKEVASRWRKFRSRLSLNHEDLAMLVSDKRGYFRRNGAEMEHLDWNPPAAKCCWLGYCKALGRRGVRLNPDWLLTGNGKMFLEPMTRTMVRPIVEAVTAELLTEDNLQRRRAREMLRDAGRALWFIEPQISQMAHALANYEQLNEAVEDATVGNVVYPAAFRRESRP